MCAFAKRVDHPPAPDPAGDAPPPAVTHIHKLCHVGCTDLSTRAFHAQLLGTDDGTVLTYEINPGEVTVSMLWDFCNAWAFVRYIDKKLIWYFRVFTFVDSGRILKELGPQTPSIYIYLYIFILYIIYSI